jgi:alkylglycerol monooxygenase
VAEKGGFPAYITAAIPCFLLMILAEFLLMLTFKLPSIGGRYVLADAWSSLTAGTVQQLVSTLVLKPLLINTLPYHYIHSTVSVPNGLALPVYSIYTWLGALVLADFAYYWLHRFAHEINILWAGHSVHHSSEHYNLSTALRQSWWQGVAAPLYYLPMALFFPTPVYMAMMQANIVSQFWIHTCLIRRLPEPIEYILMTPSHHRVHHDRR